MFSKVLGASLLTSLLFLNGCADKSDDQKLQNNLLRIETVSLKQHSEGCENNGSGNCAKIKIEYIELKNLPNLSAMEKINSKIQKKLLRLIGREKNNKNFEELMKTLLMSIKILKRNFLRRSKNGK